MSWFGRNPAHVCMRHLFTAMKLHNYLANLGFISLFMQHFYSCTKDVSLPRVCALVWFLGIMFFWCYQVWKQGQPTFSMGATNKNTCKPPETVTHNLIGFDLWKSHSWSFCSFMFVSLLEQRQYSHRFASQHCLIEITKADSWRSSSTDSLLKETRGFLVLIISGIPNSSDRWQPMKLRSSAVFWSRKWTAVCWPSWGYSTPALLAALSSHSFMLAVIVWVAAAVCSLMTHVTPKVISPFV